MQAIAIGSPETVRAVANANGMNRISILIPCHRIIGSDGKLTCYGGGLWRKKYWNLKKKTACNSTYTQAVVFVLHRTGKC